MGRMKLDNRIRTLIENGVATGHRSMFAVVGAKARDQVSILHHILSKATVSARPSILWCYKKELGFSSNRKKRMKQIKKKVATGGKSVIKEDDPFEIFVTSTQIRYCYYSESNKILGNTYGMLVLQDFEALTPNLLARTIETVEGGGLVVFLMQSVTSLKQLFAITMDVHSRFRTEAYGDIVPRFNERFILSLGSCKSCLVVDDQLNVLPISTHVLNIEPVPPNVKHAKSPHAEELQTLQNAMSDTKPIGDLLKRCKTASQAKTVLRLLDVITEKTLKATCAITAARGRGKSAALGLAVAGAVGFGYTNIFVTSPTPENLKTLFEFIVKGLQAMDYEEHADYELVQSTNPEFNKALVRMNVFREHRQTIQYIHPTDASKLGQAELVVIDEAAAIPLPLVNELISGPYLVFLSSTINGYEGTGRSLSLKLLEKLRQQASGIASNEKGEQKLSARTLHELSLDESIRYAPGDTIEAWLNKVLCLDVLTHRPNVSGTPPPDRCELYYVNRDTLFSFHKASETFLKNIMSIYVSAHYKNTPNDLQMLSDAPAHHLFVLMGPVTDQQTSLPEVLVVLQVCLEGGLSKKTVSQGLDHGRRAAGDLLPWTISQQFLDNEFPTLAGARVLRIAVHPDFQGMGYGTRALKVLEQYYQGEFPSLKESDDVERSVRLQTVEDVDDLHLLDEQLAPRVNLPPLLLRLSERPPETLDYLGVSFGLTLGLLKFWKRSGYLPVYLRQGASGLTGEHTCIMLKPLDTQGDEPADLAWLREYFHEFRRRLIRLLSLADFSKFSPHVALSLMQPSASSCVAKSDFKRKVLTRSELAVLLSNKDLRRLSQYGRNMVDHQLITDLLPVVAEVYFTDRIDSKVQLNVVQAAILLAMGLQRKSADQVAKELDLPVSQIFALFNKAFRRLSDHFDQICMDAIEQQAPSRMDIGDSMEPTALSLEEDLREAAEEIRERQKRDKANLTKEFKSLNEYAIKGSEDDWASAVGEMDLKSAKKSGIVSVKSTRVDKANQGDLLDRPSQPKTKKRKILRR